jgi:hypothetical protein
MAPGPRHSCNRIAGARNLRAIPGQESICVAGFNGSSIAAYPEQSMKLKFIIGVIAVAWSMSGCASLTTVSDDDSITGADLDMRTGLCTDATPIPCNPPRD